MLSLPSKIVILIFILLMGFALRFFPELGKKIENGILFVTPDPFYHTRRVEVMLNNLPKIPNFDYYISYPDGAYCIWPPLYDGINALIIWLLSMGKPTTGQIEWLCALYPIFYGLIVVVFVYLVGKTIFDEKIGLLASFFSAIFPGLLAWSQLGYNDHHIAEAFSLILIFYVLIQNTTYYKRALFLGLSMSFALLTWQGSILFAGLIFLISFLFEKEIPSFLSFMILLIAILPFSINAHYPGGYFSYRGLSLLHITLITIAILLFLIKYFMKRRNVLPAMLMIIILLIGSSLLFLNQSFRGGINFIFKQNPWHKTIIEFQPIYSMTGILVPQRIHEFLGRAYYFWPIMLLIYIFNFIRSKSAESQARRNFYYFIIFTVFTGIMCFFTLRYTPWFVPFYSLIFAYFIFEVYKFFKNQLPGVKFFGIIVILAILIITFKDIPFLVLFQTKKSMQIHPFPAQIKACLWLRDSTEVTSFYLNPQNRPEYGIMCFWDEGHYIVYLGKRPVAASNFGDDAPNFNLTNRYFLTESENEANDILERLNCRYVYVGPPNRILYLAPKYLGLDVKEYLKFYYVKHATYVGTLMEPVDKAMGTTIMRLFAANGSGFYYKGDYYPPYRHYQLRYYSPEIKIFKYVKGAVVESFAKRNSSVKLFLPVKIGSFSFVYTDSIVTDNKGIFQFVVPYSTDSLNPSYIYLGKKKYKLSINDSAVINGDTIRLKL
jgi:dolichyl-diphosphooligosaccharide--protein glycosyltransferase